MEVLVPVHQLQGVIEKLDMPENVTRHYESVNGKKIHAKIYVRSIQKHIVHQEKIKKPGYDFKF